MRRPILGPTAGAIALAVVLSDQFTKQAIVDGLGLQSGRDRLTLVGDWFALEYAENRGVAFGALGGNPLVAAVLALAALGGVLTYGRNRDSGGWGFSVGLGLTIGGAVGNLIDRIRLGYVVDFVAVGPWPNFNVADSAITVGVVCLAIDALRRRPAVQPPMSARRVGAASSSEGSDG